MDAGVAAGLCINVTQADLTNIGGVAPLMMYLADERHGTMTFADVAAPAIELAATASPCTM